MSEPEIDYQAVYRRLPTGIALLSPELVYIDVNEAYLGLSGRVREDLIGHYVFEVFPDNPYDPASSGRRNLAASLRGVLATGERDSMAVQRYDIEMPGRPGVYEERYWATVNIPVTAAGGVVTLIIHRVEDISAFIRSRPDRGTREDRSLEAELYLRAGELQKVNERLRRAHAREREVALALQAALLPAPHPVGRRAAVRYQPAVGALNVCGDWYDLVDLPGGRVAVAVGDVVGHGLGAACVMGQLRSALSAAVRATAGPSQALDVLGLYSRSVDGAESTTAVAAVIDWSTGLITYSSAGHPPAALLHPDGGVSFLDQATDPPLGARPEHLPRPSATTAFTPGGTLVLYTDGLVERRREDIDVGLSRLARSLTRHGAADPERLADALLAELIPDTGATDDTALVVIRL